MDTTLLTSYAALLIPTVLDKDDPISKPSVRGNHAVVRSSGWLKGSNRSIFMALFIHESNDTIRVSARSNRNGCFDYPAIPKTEIDSEKLERLAKIIIANVNKHFDTKNSES